MLYMSTFWIRVAAVLYSFGLLHAILTVLLRRSQLFRPALGAFMAGAMLHMVSLVEDAFQMRSLPVQNFYQSVSLCSWLIAVLFLYLYLRYRIESLSILLFPPVFLMTLLGGLRAPVGVWESREVRDAWLMVHVALVLLGFAAVLVVLAASLLYLLQERRLKGKRSKGGLDRLPPLGTLDEIITWSTATAFVLITLSTIVGSIWGFVEWGTRWVSEPKIAISVATWGLYLAMAWLRSVAGWRGRRAALMAVVVVAGSAATWAAHVGLRGVFAR
jgi:ABC-type transport system involved in cytochrome c biogenesis permease subunit